MYYQGVSCLDTGVALGVPHVSVNSRSEATSSEAVLEGAFSLYCLGGASEVFRLLGIFNLSEIGSAS